LNLIARPVFSGFDAAEERRERPVQSAERLLLGTGRPAALPTGVGLADLGKLRGLVVVADGCGALLPCCAALLKRSVVKLPVIL
jgi:hypothetical protein